jgi:hypothetical protein
MLLSRDFSLPSLSLLAPSSPAVSVLLALSSACAADGQAMHKTNQEAVAATAAARLVLCKVIV